jgi:hypothetical protein
MKLKINTLSIALFSICCINNTALAEIDNTVTGKVICGYQAWFNCYGDGSPVERWAHWSAGKYRSNDGFPAPGHLSIEVYPDISEYESTDLFQTGFSDFPDGTPAKLYSSFKQNAINKHFEWMKNYGIDGIALQRFLGETKDGVFKRNRDSIAVKVKNAAEKYDRIYYIMYDMSADDVDYFKNDWEHLEKDLKITDSPNYATQNGKPVICIWGFGLNSRPNAPENSLTIIHWLKEKGYYVIGGVPANWRTGTSDSHAGYTTVYNAFNMISPWSVGRYSNTTGVENFKNNYLIPDLSYCRSAGIDYQPVIFSGFSWSNWKAGSENKKNEIPRNRGEFFWQQLHNIKSLNIPNLYIAMFDEYDEGTNIMKAADSYLAIPGNQYFVTNSADGTYISSDFYLRLAGKATRVIKGIEPLTQNAEVPYSAGPVWFRTSVEQGFDALPARSHDIESSSNVAGYSSGPSAQCIVLLENAHSGKYSIRYQGRNTAQNAHCNFNLFDVDIPVSDDTKLSFWIRPLDENGRYSTVDLLMTDGTRLKNLNATDTNGNPMKPAAGRGKVEEWTEIICPVGNWLSGKTIDKILIAYEGVSSSGNFSANIDDISIMDKKTDSSTGMIPVKNTSSDKILVYKDPAQSRILKIDLRSLNKKQELTVKIFNTLGNMLLKNRAESGSIFDLDIQSLQKGNYIVVVEDNGRLIFSRKILRN